jgi:azurin
METGMRTTILTALVLALGVGACNNKSDEQPATSTTTQPAKTTTPPPTAASSPPAVASSAPPVKPTAEFKLATVGNTMLYDVTSFTVSAGQPVHLVLHNNSTMKLLPHNWALVKPGTEAAVAAAGLKKGELGGYLDVQSSDVLAYSPLAAMRSTVEVTFTAPTEPGSYPYICTVPGHYLKMKGTLVVTQ